MTTNKFNGSFLSTSTPHETRFTHCKLCPCFSTSNHSWCSCSCPGISHRMLSVRTVAYMIKLARKSTENTSSQSTPFVRTLGRGPFQSSSVTVTSFLASMPGKEHPSSTPAAAVKYTEVLCLCSSAPVSN